MPTGVTARSSVSPVRMRTTRSSGTTKILPSPTSPVRPPSQSASIVGLDEGVRDRDLEPDLLREAHLHGGAAVGLDAVELAAVALDAAHREPAHLGAVESLQHIVRLLRAHDADNELHSGILSTPAGSGRAVGPARASFTGAARRVIRPPYRIPGRRCPDVQAARRVLRRRSRARLCGARPATQGASRSARGGRCAASRDRRGAHRRVGCHVVARGAAAAVDAGRWSATASSRHSPGTPFSSWLPRSAKSIPEPTTRSLTVLETSTSPGAARAATRAPMCTAMPPTSSPISSHSPVCRPARTSSPADDERSAIAMRSGSPGPARRRSPGSRRRSSSTSRPP